MAYYNNYFPVNYQNPYYQQQLQQMQQQQAQQQALNGGYVTVRSEEEARAYPVAQGASVTFFNETEPFCYKKSAGTSPLDPPTFEIYKILKVESVSNNQPNNNTPEQQKNENGPIFDEIAVLKKQVAELQEKYNELISKKESGNNVKSIDKSAE